MKKRASDISSYSVTLTQEIKKNIGMLMDILFYYLICWDVEAEISMILLYTLKLHRMKNAIIFLLS